MARFHLPFLLAPGLLLCLASCNSGQAGNSTGVPAGSLPRTELPAELQELELPEGVDAQLWKELRLALAEALEPATVRSGSAAPVSDAARSPLIWDAGTGIMTAWHHHPGDYDQNGVVNISDLTPLAVHFGKSVPPDSPNSIEAVIDGDGNGAITIADVTPIGVNFGRVVSGYNYYGSSNPLAVPQQNDSPSLIASSISIGIDAAEGDRSAERLRYGWAYGTAPQLDLRFWVRPYDEADGSEGTVSDVIGNGNKPPVLNWSMDPLNGQLPLAAVIDASASSDPEGGPVGFAWDIDNDGEFIEGDSSLAITVEDTDPLNIGVRLSDDAGNLRTSLITYSMDGVPSWNTVTAIDKQGHDGHFSSVTAGVHQGRPWIIAVNWSNELNNGVIDYNIANDSLGSSWPGHRNLLSSTVEFSRYIDSIEIAGQPAFCLTGLNGTLSFRRAEDFAAGQWQDLQFPFSGDASECSITIARGRPMIATRLTDGNDLAIVRSTDAEGSGWGPAVMPLGSLQNSGYGASIAEIGGLPAVAYFDATDNWLRYIDSETVIPSGNIAWHSPVNVEPGVSTRIIDSLFALEDGSPGMILLKLDTGQLVFRKALNTAGDSFVTNRVLKSGLSTSSQNVPRAIVIDGIVHVFYYDPILGQLNHIASNSASGLSWGEVEVVDSVVSGEVIPCPLEVAGQPAVAYADFGSRQFRFAVHY